MKNPLFLIAFSIICGLSSCATHQKFYKADIIGFGEDAQTSYTHKKGMFKNWAAQSQPIDLLNDNRTFSRAINSVIPRGNNTTLYYATDLAIDRIKWVRRKVAKYDRETRYYIFLLTDGLDNASMQVAKNNKQALVLSSDAYRKRIERRLKNAIGSGKNHHGLTVYTMLRKGNDIRQMAIDNELSEEQMAEYLEKQFSCFRYASHGEAPALIQENEFKDIEKVLDDKLINNNLDFRVAKDYRGKRIKLTITDQEGEESRLEGTLKAFLGQYRLVNLKADGLTKDSLRTPYNKANGTRLKALPGNKRDNNVFFTLSGLRKAETGRMLQPVSVKQAFYDGTIWQNNTEYEKTPYVRPNAYCIFLIDGSLSLTDEDVQAEKAVVKKIIKIIDPKVAL